MEWKVRTSKKQGKKFVEEKKAIPIPKVEKVWSPNRSNLAPPVFPRKTKVNSDFP